VISITPRVDKRLEKAGAIKRKNRGQRKRFFAQNADYFRVAYQTHKAAAFGYNSPRFD